MPKQTQYKPNQSQFQTAHLLIDRTKPGYHLKGPGIRCLDWIPHEFYLPIKRDYLDKARVANTEELGKMLGEWRFEEKWHVAGE